MRKHDVVQITVFKLPAALELMMAAILVCRTYAVDLCVQTNVWGDQPLSDDNAQFILQVGNGMATNIAKLKSDCRPGANLIETYGSECGKLMADGPATNVVYF